MKLNQKLKTIHNNKLSSFFKFLYNYSSIIKKRNKYNKELKLFKNKF